MEDTIVRCTYTPRRGNAWPAHPVTAYADVEHTVQSSGQSSAHDGLDLPLCELQYYPRLLMGSAAPPPCRLGGQKQDLEGTKQDIYVYQLRN